jgi:hypothetical protein
MTATQQPSALDLTEMSSLELALALAERGVHVFPVDNPGLAQCAGVGKGHDRATCNQRGKHPAVAWSQHATTNPKMLATWFTGAPRNVGIHCGMSNLVVIDEDRLGEFQRYADEHGVQIPPTFTVTTGKGRHYYFTAREDHPLGNKEGALKEYCIDVRAGNGYVVGPGSIHSTGVVYTVENPLPPAPIPDWVIDAVTQTNGSSGDYAQPGPAGQTPGFELPDVIKDRSRDGTLFSYASSLRARSVPYSEAEILMQAAWQRCEQPPVASHEYTWEEALGKLRGAYDRYAEGPSAEYERDSKHGNGQSPCATEARRRLRLTPLSTIKPRPVRWVWANRIPAGELTLTPGRGGLGKSTFHAWAIANITHGTLSGAHFGTPKACIIAASEDSYDRTIVPRLIAAGAAMDRVYRVDVVTEADEEVAISLPLDIVALAGEISIDPVVSVLLGALDTHKDREVRQALEPLGRLADQTGCSVLGNAHFNKSAGSDPLSLIMGSAAFGNVSRAALGFARDTEAEDGSVVISQVKNNLGRLDLPSLRYRIDSETITTEEGPAEVGRLVMLGESDRSVADILSDQGRKDRSDGDDQGEVEAWLAALLADGPVQATDVYRAADANGYSKDRAKRAKKKLGIKATHPDITGPWFWEIPQGSVQGVQGSASPKPRSLAPLGAPLGGEQDHGSADDELVGPPFYRCQTCGAGLWHPESQERGTCERCSLGAREDKS